LAPATGSERAAWLLMAAGLGFILHFKLVPALVAGLCVHTLIHALTARLTGGRLSHGRARILVEGSVSDGRRGFDRARRG
jgi:hypothetical protein